MSLTAATYRELAADRHAWQSSNLSSASNHAPAYFGQDTYWSLVSSASTSSVPHCDDGGFATIGVVAEGLKLWLIQRVDANGDRYWVYIPMEEGVVL